MAYYNDIKPKFSNDGIIGYDIVEDVEAVKNALINLFTIRKGEVPGKPWLGNPLSLFLFDNIGFFEQKTMETSFRNTISLYEPRVRISRLTVNTSPEYNRISIYLEFWVLINNRETFENLRISLAHNEMTSIATRQA